MPCAINMTTGDASSLSPGNALLPLLVGSFEIPRELSPRPGLTHIVFDFDGTLSWVRHGWPEIMFGVFARNWRGLADETESARRSVMEEIVFGMNGRPTILQMQRFAELMNARGEPVLNAETLRVEFQNRLDAEIATRLELIRTARAQPDDFVIFGARSLLEHLKRIGMTLVILSSTVEHRVREEADALKLAEFFGRHIYGSGADAAAFSKMAVLRRLLAEEGIEGANLLSLGDGPVEISGTKELGGAAIAICSDENQNGSGKMDAFKKQQLLAAGADAALPDFRDCIALMNFLLQK